MKSLGVTLSLLFSLCACAFSVLDSWLQPEWIEDLKNTKNNEISQTQSPHVLQDKDVPSLNSKGRSIILSVMRETEDVYSLEDTEHETTEDEQTEQDDIPIIISSEHIQEDVAVSSFNSSEFFEKHITNDTEVTLQTLVPITSTEVLKSLDKMMTQIKVQDRMINELKKSNKNLRNKFDQIDQRTKFNSVIFMNIRESKHENYKSLLQKVIQILNRIMKLRVSTDNIVMASRIRGSNTDRFRPVVVTFTNHATKLRVLANRSNLKISKFDIVDDYTELINQTRRLLLPYLYEKRRQGHKVSMIQDRLMVNGAKKSLSDLRLESTRKIQEEGSKPKAVEDKCSQEKPKAEKKNQGA